MSYHIAEPSLSLEDISAQRNLEKQSGLEGPRKYMHLYVYLVLTSGSVSIGRFPP